jgi:Tol biopolymer transport system component
MGEVYRAHDTKLERDVAIKVLPPAFMADAERLTRFEREARLLASLNHPNIAVIYGVEESGGHVALVLELVEGQTLAEKLRPRGLALGEAIAIAKQIADALDAAHERGIVHRDLKPANIKMTPDGVAKVLDFGLAKASGAGEAGRTGWAGEDLTHSPTMIGPTIGGVLVGTAPYMSPEQARGKSVDKRTDIWAFGCVLYEMLTGRPAFTGETATDVLAKIVEREPDWTKLPPSTPPHIVRLLRRCLENDPKRRLRDIGDARVELDGESRSPIGSAVPSTWPLTLKVLMAAAASLAALLAIAVAVLWLRAAPTVHPTTHFTFGPPDDVRLEDAAPVPAPDGTRIAFVTRNAAGQHALWIRSLGSTTPQRIPGSDGATGTPFWSPDGRFVGFFAEGKLKKADLSGGAVLNICAMRTNLGATWNKDNVIVLAPVNRTVLHRVPAAGGAPEPITTLNADRRENSHRWPHFLPDGRHFLFTARSDVKENNLIYVGSLDSKNVTPLRAAQSNAVYVSPGFLLFAQEGTLMAQRFDARALALHGDPFPVAERVMHTTPSSSAMFGASSNGAVLAYQSSGPRLARIVSFDRAGKPGTAIGPEREFTEVRLAPNEHQATVVIPDPDSGNRDIWLLDLASGALTRVTTHPANDWQVAWAPDGRQIAFASDRNGRSSVYTKAIPEGEEQLLLQMPDSGVFPRDWSADGRYISLGVDDARGRSSIWALPLFGDRKPFSLLQETAVSNDAMISADGQWIVYQSDDSGALEVYLKPFARPGKVRVSGTGGALPRWRRDGHEFFYITPRGDVMSVPFPRDGRPETPVRLFTACTDVSPGGQVIARPSASYDVTAEGTRFLLACAIPEAMPEQITVSVDWSASIK